MTPETIYHYRDYLIYFRPYCGQVLEVFINHLSAGLSHTPAQFAKSYIDSNSVQVARFYPDTLEASTDSDLL